MTESEELLISLREEYRNVRKEAAALSIDGKSFDEKVHQFLVGVGNHRPQPHHYVTAAIRIVEQRQDELLDAMGRSDLIRPPGDLDGIFSGS